MKLNIKFISLTIALVSPILYGSFCSALTNQKLNMFSQNNIMFYDPDECLPGGPSTSSTFAGGTFTGNGFNASDDELARLYRAAVSENSCSPGAIKNELSIMANLAEKNGYSSVGDYVLRGGWFADHTRDVYNYSSEPVSAEELEIARDIINNGNRTFPPQLVEHDCLGDLIKLEVRGQTYYGTGPDDGCDGTGLEDRSLYIPGETIITNAYKSTYIFYGWAGGPDSDCGDAFGYFADNPPPSIPSASGGSTSSSSSNASSGGTDGSSSSSSGSGAVCAAANTFTYYNQGDSQWSSSSFGSSTVGRSGCAPTSFAMLSSMLLGRQITPTETAQIAGDAGMYVPGAGASWDITRVLAEHYGLEYQDISASSTQEAIDNISKYLKEGWMIHTSGRGAKPFTAGGHYIGIRGITEDGKWLIADSAHSEEDSTRPWDPADIVSGMYIDNIKAIRGSSDNSNCRSSTNNYCAPSSSASGGSADGFNSVNDANGIISAYTSDPLNYNLVTPPTGDKHDNCVAFSLWFINYYTDISYDPGLTGDGRDFVDYFFRNMSGEYPDLQISNSPSVYSVASWASPTLGTTTGNHTGIVVGIDESNSKILIAEAGYGNHEFTGIHEYDLKEATGSTSFKYINLNAHLKSNSGLN